MRRNCPECGARTVRLSLFNVRRKRSVSCGQCGSSLAVVIPAGKYHLITLTASVLASLLVPVILMMMFARQWTKVALAIGLIFALILGSNELLNRRATVQPARD